MVVMPLLVLEPVPVARHLLMSHACARVHLACDAWRVHLDHGLDLASCDQVEARGLCDHSQGGQRACDVLPVVGSNCASLSHESDLSAVCALGVLESTCVEGHRRYQQDGLAHHEQEGSSVSDSGTSP